MKKDRPYPGSAFEKKAQGASKPNAAESTMPDQDLPFSAEVEKKHFSYRATPNSLFTSGQRRCD